MLDKVSAIREELDFLDGRESRAGQIVDMLPFARRFEQETI